MDERQELQIEEKKRLISKIDFKKFVDFFKNKAVIWGIVLTVVYLASGFWKWLEIGVPVIAFFAFIFLSLQSGFCLLAYLHCFARSNIDYYPMVIYAIICYAVVLLFKYLKGLKEKKYPIYIKLALIIIIFTLASVIISLFNLPVYTVGLTYLAYLPLFYLIFAMRKEFNVDKAIQSLFLGLIVSNLLSLTFGFMPHFQYSPFVDKRFMAFVNCTNYFYMRVFVVLTYFMAKNLLKTLKFYKFCLIYLICSAMIMVTKSKTAIVLLAFFTILYLIIYVCQDFKKRYYVAIISLAVLALICFLARSFILEIFARFRDGSGNWTLNSITTGRTEIWKEYLKQSVQTPFSFFLGRGFFGKQPFVSALGGEADAHNILILFLYRFGLIGCYVIGYIIYLFVKLTNKKTPKFVSFLPLIWFLLESLADNTFKIVNVFLLVLVCMALYSNQINDKK